MTDSSRTWPERIFRSPLLKRLDERGRHDLVLAGTLVDFEEGQQIYRAGDPSDALYVVVEGVVELGIVARGDELEKTLRERRAGDSFGEESVIVGARRSSKAVARSRARVAEIPFSVFNRVVVRGGGAEFIDREIARLRRAVTRDLLASQAFTRDLGDDDLELLLDAVRYQRFEPGDEIYVAGTAAKACFLLQYGLVQVQREEDGRVSVRAYLSAGDLFGDEALGIGATYRYGAVASSETHCLVVGHDVMRTIADRNPGLADRVRRLRVEREAEQASVVPVGPRGATQHVLRDVYRMQMARSLLAIDQDRCVRCGHCAWACADLHEGVTRLVRRGDKVVAQRTRREGAPTSLLLPNTCQHCENPACMVDCPTGAIGRDPEGEVFIREELCTGCGACAKACPWENIQMSLRPLGSKGPEGAGALLAVKCDLCREYEGPACVQACPVDALQRLDPTREFEQVKRLFGRSRSETAERAVRPARIPMWPALVVFGAVVAAAAALPERFEALASRVGLLSGWLGALGCTFLVSYAAVKRGQRYWLKKRPRRRRFPRDAAPAPASSRVSTWLDAHVAVGWLTLALVIVHGGMSLRNNLAGVLALTFIGMVLSGAWLVLAFRLLPARLARLESKGALPEDLPTEQRVLEDRVYQLTSGKDQFTKTVAEVLLLPYARSSWESLRLLLSGRSLAAERKRLEDRVQTLTEGRAGTRIETLADLIKTVVDLRALPVRRVLSASLRGLQPVHAGLSVTLFVLLCVHVLGYLL